jgi:hypothetical protein
LKGLAWFGHVLPFGLVYHHHRSLFTNHRLGMVAGYVVEFDAIAEKKQKKFMV